MNPRRRQLRAWPDFATVLSPHTVAGYTKRADQVRRWCEKHALSWTSVDGLSLFLIAHDYATVGALRVSVCAVNRHCFDHGLPIPGHSFAVRAVLRGLQRPRTGRIRVAPALTPAAATPLLIALLSPPPRPWAVPLTALLRLSREIQVPAWRLLRCHPTSVRTAQSGMVVEVPVGPVGRWQHRGAAPPEAVLVAEPRGVRALHELLESRTSADGLLFAPVGLESAPLGTSPRALRTFYAHETRLAAHRARVPAPGLDPFLGAGLDHSEFERLLAEFEPALLRRHRDAALVAVGLAGACRPTALGAIWLEDGRRHGGNGFDLFVRADKTEPAGHWQAVAHGPTCRVTCPACRLDDLLRLLHDRGIRHGPLFSTIHGTRWTGRPLGARDMTRILQPYGFTARSLRRGAATALHQAGGTAEDIRGLLRHRSGAVWQRYVDGGDLR